VSTDIGVSAAGAIGELWHLPFIFRAQYQHRDRITAMQLREIQRFLACARKTTPYYARKQYRGSITSLADFTSIPVLRKGDILEIGESQFRSSAMTEAAVVMTCTSGTSGARLNVAHDRRHFAYHNATCLRRFLATRSYRPWYRLLHLRPTEMPTRWYQRLGLFRRDVVLSSWPPEHVRARLLASKPHVLIGYPTMLRELLRILTPAELGRLRSSLRLVLTESELLLPEHRAQLSEAFGAPVYDEYSAWEVLNITFECSTGSAHVAEDRVLVEIVDQEFQPVPDGEEGSIVVTAFRERAMPLVRYWLGDRGRLVPGDCGCGRTFRRLQLTSGRSDDHVVLPDGSVLYVATFLYLAAEAQGVAESVVRQTSDGRIIVYLVPDRQGESDFEIVARSYLDQLFRLAERRFPVEVRPLDRLALTEGGKGRFLVSDYRP
jgi:phenylacetate-CoA ligase